MFDPVPIRAHFPALSVSVHGRPLVYLDNAATAQMPQSVADTAARIELRRGNVHRGIHTLSEDCTAAYENARAVTAAFIGAAPEQITFTSGTTDAVNRIADSFRWQLGPGDTVLVTRMEHHSNFIPWQQLCRDTGAELRVLPLTDRGELDPDALDAMLSGAVKLVAVTHISNVLGTVNDVKQICAQAHRAGAQVFVDGAQGVCHLPVDVEELGCDYYAFSGHKLGAPFGTGALYARRPYRPVRYGGGMVDEVREQNTTFAPSPLGWEAGTPNVSGAAGMAEALRFRQALPQGWQDWEDKLLKRAEDGLDSMPGVRVLGAPRSRSGCLSFVMEGASPFDVAVLLDQLGVALRSGHHCAQPLLHSLGLDYALRISPAFYNTAEEIDTFLNALARVRTICALH